MYLPVPVLAVLGIALLALVLLALRRRSGGRDLIAPPRHGPASPPPQRAEPSRAWPPGAAPIGDVPGEIEGEVRELIAADRKIEAIKLVRASTGLGLAEAKDLVERM